SGQEQIIALTYTDGVSTLSVYEQRGALDDEALREFVPTHVAGSTVWVRPGAPLVATWDDDGVVYTVVTDADRERLLQAVRDLPRTPRSDGALSRIRGGIERLTGLATPAETQVR